VSTQLPPPPLPERPAAPLPEAPVTHADVEASPSRAPLVVGGLLIVALLVGTLAVWRWAFAPAACANANVRSVRFGYCLTAPDGWSEADPTNGQLSADELFRLNANATLTIQAVGSPGDLDTFAAMLRGAQQKAGSKTGATRTTEVDGADAVEWDGTLTTGSGAIRARTVVFERGGFAWRLEFADTADGFDRHVPDLGRILRSWHFT
jgi:hypothetical protein